MSGSSLCITYEKVLEIETDIANSVLEKMENNDGVYLPDENVKNNPVYFAIDNCDCNNDTSGSKNELHDTAQIAMTHLGVAFLNLLKTSENHVCCGVFYNTVAGWRPANLLKERLHL